MNQSRYALVLGFIVMAGMARIAPHPLNFTPIGALALFAGAHLREKWLAYLAPMLALLLGDLVTGPHPLMVPVYACFAVTVTIGILIRNRRRFLPVAVATLASSVLFFVVTNFAVWALGRWYPTDLAGLASCYLAGIPYFRNTLLGDALYTVVLFGGMALAEKNFPRLREAGSGNER